jgi:hypothetical protein
LRLRAELPKRCGIETGALDGFEAVRAESNQGALHKDSLRRNRSSVRPAIRWSGDYGDSTFPREAEACPQAASMR